MSRSALTVAVLAFAAYAADASAQGQTPAATPRATLGGDWDGIRTKMAEDGIAIRADYVSESFSVVQGGLRHGSAYAQQLRAGVDLDMARIAAWQGAKFHLTVNDRRGKGISSDVVGNRLPIQETYGGQYTRLSELSYEQDSRTGRVNLRLGYFAMGNDLGGIAAGCNFVNAAFCAHPLSMSGNSNWYNYPNARWGGALRIHAREDVTLRTGIFQVNPSLGEQANAFKPFAGHTRGMVLPIELEYTPGQQPDDRWLPGSYKLGYYHDTAEATATPGPGSVTGRDGYYLLASQTVWREKAGARGMSVIGAYTANPGTAAQITRWYMLGLVKTGTLAGRDNDTLGLGIVRARLNPRIQAARIEATPALDLGTSPSGETAIELSYGFQANRWLLLRPDVQYIQNPGAFSNRSIRNALALGLQIKMQL